MNKSILFIIITFLFSISAIGQSYVGAFVGVNSSKLSGDSPPLGTYKSLLGLNVGAHFDIKLSKLTALSLQPSYSQEGTKILYSVPRKTELVDSLRFRINYFSLPLLFRVTSTNEKFYAIAGIEPAYLLNKSLKSQNTTLALNETFANFNVAVHFGAGIRIPLGYPRLFIEMRYTQGLVNLTDEPFKNNILPRVKTSGFKVLAGIEIPLQKSKN